MRHCNRPARQLTNFVQILWPLDKRQGDPVRSHLERKGEIAAVLVGDGGDGQHGPDHAHPLALGQGPANQDAGLRGALGCILDREPHLAVINE